jgi:hypothetical protein
MTRPKTKVELQAEIDELRHELGVADSRLNTLRADLSTAQSKRDAAIRGKDRVVELMTNLAMAASYWRGRAGEVPPEFDAKGLLDVIHCSIATKETP